MYFLYAYLINDRCVHIALKIAYNYIRKLNLKDRIFIIFLARFKYSYYVAKFCTKPEILVYFISRHLYIYPDKT